MTTYAELLAAAQADPYSADFHALRMAYVRSDQYRPYTQQRGLIAALDTALRSSDLDGALQATEKLLHTNYLDIEAHMAAAYVYTMRENIERAAYHHAFAKGLIEAILNTGTGREPDSAFIVIDIPEEYTIMRIVGLEPGRQSLIDYQGRRVDMFEVRPLHAPDGTPPFKIYFNIDLPYTWLNRRMDAHEAASKDETP